jgi:hypothetical protein
VTPSENADVSPVPNRRLAGTAESQQPCGCMTEDPGDGYGERVVTHSGKCPLHPDYDETAARIVLWT